MHIFVAYDQKHWTIATFVFKNRLWGLSTQLLWNIKATHNKSQQLDFRLLITKFLGKSSCELWLQCWGTGDLFLSRETCFTPLHTKCWHAWENTCKYHCNCLKWSSPCMRASNIKGWSCYILMLGMSPVDILFVESGTCLHSFLTDTGKLVNVNEWVSIYIYEYLHVLK